MSETLASSAAAIRRPKGRIRWVISALLFTAMIFNYVDRQMIGVLKPTLQTSFGWSEVAYGDIIFYFQIAYALAYVLFGRLVDALGAKLGYTVAFVIWTVGHTGHALATSAIEFTAARMVLGAGEGGSFPAGVKAIAEWFPKGERALAIGLVNAGTNIGAILTPLIVPFIAIDLALGWRGTFVITGVASLFWLAAWLLYYRSPREHPSITPDELAYVEADPEAPTKAVGWRKALAMRETWAYAAGKFLIDPVWWMFLFWLPDFFAKRYHMDLKSFGPPLVIIYLLADVGSVAGGWASGVLIRRGLSINAARKLTMLVCAVLVLPVAFATHIANLWAVVAVLGLATAAHQGFSANLYTFPSDVFPKAAVGTVVGIGGTAGAVGGMLMAKYAGWILDRVGDYGPIFMLASVVYFLALGAVHLLSPRYAPAGGRG